MYSLHKSSTRAHVARVAAGELRAASAEVLVQLRFDLPASYTFHRRAPQTITLSRAAARAWGRLYAWWSSPTTPETWPLAVDLCWNPRGGGCAAIHDFQAEGVC